MLPVFKGERIMIDKTTYDKALIASESAEIDRRPHDVGKKITILVDRGASGNYFEDH